MSDQATFIVGLVGTLIISMGMILVANLGDETPTPTLPKTHQSQPVAAPPELQPDYAQKSNCDECIAAGASWNATKSACVARCSGGHTNCFTLRCPVPCTKTSCSTCYNQGDCQETGCYWNVEKHVSWCSEKREPAR